jgi:hypothetical protein
MAFLWIFVVKVAAEVGSQGVWADIQPFWISWSTLMLGGSFVSTIDYMLADAESHRSMIT